jgi:hypothetical protein
MVTYCANDVRLLEKVYKRMLPFMNGHPNRNYYDETTGSCPKCGSKELQKRGFSFKIGGKVQRYQCTRCGGWCNTGKKMQNVN